MKCPSCQASNTDTARFCSNCAAPLASSDEAQPSFTKTLETPVDELTRGTRFADRYEIIEELGRGGMGKVYRAEDKKIEQEIALKLIKPEIASNKKTLERFSNELKTARMISHRNVCRMFDLGEASGTHYLTMEYVRGEDLKSMIRMSGQLSIGTATKIAAQICAGLSEAHRLGVIHRDLKPNNIMLDKEGSARIMDFGIARSLKSKGLTGAGVMIGTPEYMSPEQVEGKDVDQRSDIYSLGILLYEMLTGRLPFAGDTPFSIGIKQKSETPEAPQKYNPHIPDDLNHLILKCLAKEKESRPQSAGEVCSEINRIEEGMPTTVKPVPDKKTLTSKEITVTFTTKKILLPTVVFVAVVVAGILLWRTLRSPDVFIPPEERLTVAVISFENHTGDETYAHLQKVIPNLLITNLEQSGYFNVTSWQRLQDLLKQIDKRDVEFIDADLGFVLCRMEGVEAIVIGSYAKAGEMFATDVKVLDVASKRLLKSTSTRGEGEGSILKTQIDELSKEISIGIGIPESRIETAPLRVAEVTTSSMEAYKHYIEGREAVDKFYWEEALNYFKQAVELDPNFGAATFFLAYINGVQGNIQARDEAIKKGKELAAMGATEKERLWIDVLYARFIEKDQEKSVRILQEMADKYPKEKEIQHVLGMYIRPQEPDRAIEAYNKALELDPNYAMAVNNLAYVYLDIGRYEEAEIYFKRYVELSPGEANPHDSLGDLYFNMGRLDEAAAKYKEASEIRPGYFSAYEKLGYVSALKQNYPEALKWIQKNLDIASSSGDKVNGYLWKGFLLVWLGRYTEALIDLQRAEELAEALGDELAAAFVNKFRAWTYLYMGEFELSRSSNEEWLDVYQKNYPSSKTSYECNQIIIQGYIDLKLGQTESAKKRLDSIQSLDPEISTTGYFLFQGEVRIAENSIDLAIDSLEKVIPDRPSSSLQYARDIINYNLPFFMDGIARAYHKKKDLDKAIAAYQRLITFNPSSDNRRLIHPRYFYRLAVLYEEKGDTAKALEHYEKFLTFWKDADPGITEVEDAKESLAELAQIRMK